MSQTAENPITLDRFATGKTWKQYIESGIRNREIFEQNYAGLKVSAEQENRLKALKARGLDHMVVIGEDWCPDVYRGAGVAQRIAEAAGIEMRFFERDQHKDMIQGYLKEGQFESIPVFVFYDKGHKELGHFIERPRLANEQMHETREVLGDMTPEGIAKKLGHEPSEAELAQARAEGRTKYMEWQKGPTWANWRVATVDECIGMLEQATA